MKKQKPKLVITPANNLTNVARQDLDKVVGGGSDRGMKPKIPKVIDGCD